MSAMDVTFESYFAFLEKLGQKLDQLTELARKKTAAVRRDDLLTVNDCMKEEQVLSLTLRGMDQKRDKMLDALGLSGVSLRELPSHCPEELRQTAEKTVEALQAKYSIYQSAAETTRTILEMNLHEIGKYLQGHANGVPADLGGGPGGSLADIRA